MKKRILFLLLLNLALLLSACNQPASAGITTADAQPATEQTVSVPVIEVTEATDRPAGWTEATHSNEAAPNYAAVLPQDSVNRLDITITPENWQAMLDDMTALYGEPGTRAARPEGGPQRPGGNAPQDGAVPQRPGNAPQRPGNPPAGLPQSALPAGRPGNAPDGMMLEGDVNPTYVPVTVVFEGQTWTNVGLRFKGNSSLRSTWERGNLKLPMRLDFDQFEDEYPEIKNQRFYGFKQLALANNFSDASLLREKVTADIFRAAGVPAAQTAFYEIYVDHGEGPVYFGLYTLTEIVDDTVIQTQFANDGNIVDDGNVYKPSGRGATFAAGTFNTDAFDKQTNEDDADWSDVQALYDNLHADTRTSNPAAWRAGLEAVFDVDGFLNWLAVNAVVQNWDTYGAMSHNYYLYHDPTTGRLVWIPWDNNMALTDNVGRRTVASLSMDEIGAEWPLIHYLLDDAEYHARYVAYVETVSATAFEAATMEATYRQLAALIEPYVLAETPTHTQLTSTTHFYAAIDELVAHAYARREAVNEFIAVQKTQEVR